MKKLFFVMTTFAVVLFSGCEKHDFCKNTKLYLAHNVTTDTVYYSLKGWDDDFKKISPNYSREILPIYETASNNGPDIDIQVSDIIGSFDYINIVYFKINGKKYIDIKSGPRSMISADSYIELRGGDIYDYVPKSMQKKYTQYFMFEIDDNYIKSLLPGIDI